MFLGFEGDAAVPFIDAVGADDAAVDQGEGVGWGRVGAADGTILKVYSEAEVLIELEKMAKKRDVEAGGGFLMGKHLECGFEDVAESGAFLAAFFQDFEPVGDKGIGFEGVAGG